MGQKVSGRVDVRSAPFQKVFTSFAAAVDLTEALPQARCAASGLLVLVGAAGTGNLVWKDCAGSTNTLALANSAVVDLPFAVASIEVSTITGSVIAYWHSNGGA